MKRSRSVLTTMGWWCRTSVCLVTATVVMNGLVATPLTAQTISASDPATYVRYLTPGQCTAAAERMYRLYWRDKRPDTVTYAPQTDSVPTPVVQAATACASHFTVATAPVRELLNLTQLYLWSRQDSLARAAADRLVAEETARPQPHQGWTLWLLCKSFLNARPTHLDAARQYIAQLDSLDTSAVAWRMFAHSLLASTELQQGNLPTTIAEAQAAIAAGKRMSNADRIDWLDWLYGNYTILAEVTAAKTSGAAAIDVLAQADTDLTPVRPISFVDLTNRYKMYGAKASPIQATHMYNAGSDTTFPPHAGKISLFVFVNIDCGAACYRSYATLRRMYDKYASAGLEITLMGSTAGYFRNQLMPNPAAESDSLQRYFLNFLDLPATLAVTETKFSHRPDGRRVNMINMNQSQYARGPNGILIGRDGKIRAVINILPEREKLLDQLIQSVVPKQ